MSNVLVVEDSAVDRRFIRGILARNADWAVDFAEDGQQALDLIAKRLPDIVVTDLVMPGMDGLELVTRLRSEFPGVPVILMTSRGNDETAVRALRSGASTYVPKRLLETDLADSVRSVLAVSGEQQQHARLFRCMRNAECNFVLENDAALFPPLIGYLQETVTQTGLADEADRVRIGIALEESLSNAFYHGNLELDSGLRESDPQTFESLVQSRCGQSPYRDRRINLRAAISRSEAVFVISDDGPGFNLASLPDPTDPANLERITGRGVLLMRSFMDEVRYNDRGNEVTLMKKRKKEEG